MARSGYQPKRGDFVYVNCNPQAGTEQAGRRPGLVISETVVNIGTGVAYIAPITNQAKGGPLEVAIPAGLAVTGVVLTEHMKSFDWLARQVEFAGTAPADLMDEVVAKIAAILGIS